MRRGRKPGEVALTCFQRVRTHTASRASFKVRWRSVGGVIELDGVTVLFWSRGRLADRIARPECRADIGRAIRTALNLPETVSFTWKGI